MTEDGACLLNYLERLIQTALTQQEIGYTDTILDVRSNRVRTLLGSCSEGPEDPILRGSYDKQRERCDPLNFIRKVNYGMYVLLS